MMLNRLRDLMIDGVLLALATARRRGGPTADDRTAQAITCAKGLVGIAPLVAMACPGPRLAVHIAVCVVESAAISMPYLTWRRTPAATSPAMHLSQ
ncbi:MAG: hypothetical protein ACK54X_22755 [Burkholderiales bacterium]|jgi:hypothetical protein